MYNSHLFFEGEELFESITLREYNFSFPGATFYRFCFGIKFENLKFLAGRGRNKKKEVLYLSYSSVTVVERTEISKL